MSSSTSRTSYRRRCASSWGGSMSEWRKTTMDQLVKLQRGHDLPTGQRRQGSVPVVGAAGPSGFHDTAIVKAPGVTLGRAGASMGHATYCNVDFWPLNTSLYVTDFLGNDPRFAFYLLGQIDFSGYNSGAAQPMLNRNYITQISINLPPLEEQRSICTILGSLDDKIAVNERIATTAEEITLAIASSTRWDRRVRLGEICSLRKEQCTPQELDVDVVDHYSLPAFDAEKTADRTSPASIKSSKFMIPEAAILLSKLNPEIPRVWNVEPDEKILAIASTEFLVLTPVLGVSTHQLWAVAAQQDFRSALASRVTGTSKSHQRVRPAEALATKVVDPRQLGEEGQQINRLAEKTALMRKENRTLAALRGTLLPQLMSGRLRVRDAEKIVEDNA
ncbi:restriction endonuclease subunit S [Streptomyces halstedii]|uniref:restriction endonuclease subunit S n=1 Tax=Streptomyces halstedii TaxID=1944 RepID=UPI0037A31960